MARHHWRFVVRDQYGYVVQNALVYVYLPGTTTVFSGTAYDAASGGSTVTNPFTSNAYGEVEAWFDTAQVVDVLVTDNSDAAYRAVEGASATLSFTSFTESDDIYLAASDQIDHGAAEHTNITRKLWLPAEAVTLGTGSAMVTAGTGANISRTVEFSDAASEDASWSFAVPYDWASGALSAQLVISGVTTNTGALRWVFTAKKVAAAADVTAAGTATTFTGVNAAHTANFLFYETDTEIITPTGEDELVLLNIQRVGADGADTYASVIRVHGVIISYTAEQ